MTTQRQDDEHARGISYRDHCAECAAEEPAQRDDVNEQTGDEYGESDAEGWERCGQCRELAPVGDVKVCGACGLTVCPDCQNGEKCSARKPMPCAECESGLRGLFPHTNGEGCRYDDARQEVGLSPAELAALDACVNRAEEDLANWSPEGAEEEAAKRSAEVEWVTAETIIARLRGELSA